MTGNLFVPKTQRGGSRGPGCGLTTFKYVNDDPNVLECVFCKTVVRRSMLREWSARHDLPFGSRCPVCEGYARSCARIVAEE